MVDNVGEGTKGTNGQGTGPPDIRDGDGGDEKGVSLWWLIALVLPIIFVLLGIGYYLSTKFCSWEQRGQFGDMFGVANALFSALAFGGVVFAIILQRKELEYQRKELRLAREQYTRSASAQEETSRLLEGQFAVMKAEWESQKRERFVFSYKEANDGKWKFQVTNAGAKTLLKLIRSEELEIISPASFDLPVPEYGEFDFEFGLKAEKVGNSEAPRFFRVVVLDIEDDPHTREFVFLPSQNTITDARLISRVVRMAREIIPGLLAVAQS